MKKIFHYLLALSLIFPVGLSAQVKIKILDKSAKKIPVWVNSVEEDYIITTGVAGDLETAKQLALENVRKYIIRSVAENVTSTTEGNISQQTVNNEIVSFLDEYRSSYQTQAAPVPFLKGISESRIESYYWEKREDKSTRKITYVYSIRYPFPRVELKSLVHEFQKRDKEIYGIYLTLTDQLGNVTSLEQIDRAVADLRPVINYLFDDVRKNQAQSLQNSYKKLYDNITFKTISSELGTYKFGLQLDGRAITTSQRTTLKSESATQITAEPNAETIEVRYKYDGCAWDEENAISVGFRFGGKTVNHKFFFTVKKFDIKVWPEKTVYLTAATKDSLMSNIDIRIFVRSEYNKPYIIKSLTLDIPGISEPLFIDDLNTQFNSKESTLNVTWINNIEPVRKQNYRLNMLRGNMEVEIPSEGITKRIDFALPFKANW